MIVLDLAKIYEFFHGIIVRTFIVVSVLFIYVSALHAQKGAEFGKLSHLTISIKTTKNIYIYKITNHIHTKILKGYPFLTPFMMFDVRKL